jgi:large subunit ribosomal protein L17
MRHGDKVNNLGRTSSHRKALLSNMSSSLITHKRIFTTIAKAKALRKFVEPILTRSKTDSTHSRRMAFADLKSKEAVSILYRDIASKIATRPGGYTRIIKTGPRKGDNAEMALIELVDFNELLLGAGSTTDASKPKATRRSRKKADGDTVAEANDSPEAQAPRTRKKKDDSSEDKAE